MTQPSSNEVVTGGGTVSIAWDGDDPDSDATVWLALDTDRDYQNGGYTTLPGAGELAEDGTLQVTAGDLSNFEDGTYYVLGVIEDEDSEGYDYAPGSLSKETPAVEITSVSADLGGGRFLSGSGIPEVINTFSARVAGPTTSVEFALDGEIYTDDNGSDGWSTPASGPDAFNMSSLEENDDLVVTAYATEENRDSYTYDINVFALPEWMGDANAEWNAHFDPEAGSTDQGGYEFDVLLRDLRKGFSTPEEWWLVGNKWSGFRMGQTFHLQSLLDGTVSSSDLGYLFEAKAFDHYIFQEVIPFGVDGKWKLDSGLSFVGSSWGDFASIEPLDESESVEDPQWQSDSGWYIEGGMSGNYGVNNDLTFSAFDLSADLSIGYEAGVSGESSPIHITLRPVRLPILGSVSIPPGVLDMVFGGSIGVSGALHASATTSIDGQGNRTLTSGSVGPEFQFGVSGYGEMQVVGGALKPLGGRVTGTVEQNFLATWNTGDGWRMRAPGSLEIGVDVYSAIELGKWSTEHTWWSHEWNVADWDFIDGSGSDLDESGTKSSRSGGKIQDVAMSAGGGRVDTVYAGNPELYTRHRNGSGQWSSWETITSNEFYESASAVGHDAADNAHAVWGQSTTPLGEQDSASMLQRAQNQQIYWASDDGSGWSAPAAIADDNYVHANPDIAFSPSGTQGMAVWERGAADGTSWVDGTTLEIMCAIWDGNNWSAPRRITDDSVPDWGASVSYTDSGQAVLSWVSDLDGDYRDGSQTHPTTAVRSAVFDGTSWDLSTLAQDGERFSGWTGGARNGDGDVEIFWTRAGDGGYDLTMSAYNGAQFQTLEHVLSGEQYIGDPEVSGSSDGRVIVSYLGSNGKEQDVYAISHASPWAEAVDVTDDSLDYHSPVAVIGDEGKMVVGAGFEDFNETGETSSSAYDGSTTEDGLFSIDASAFTPVVTIENPISEVNGGEKSSIEWNDADLDSDASVAIFWDTDASQSNNTADEKGTTWGTIATGISEDEDSDSYLWTVDAPTGVQYYLLATISDEESEASDYSGSMLFVNAPPTVASLSDSPDPVTGNESLLLTAEDVSDPDEGDSVTKVRFYRDGNGDLSWNPGDEVLGTDLDSSNGWSITVAGENLVSGENTYFARAFDGAAWSDSSGTASTTGTVGIGFQPIASVPDLHGRGPGGSVVYDGQFYVWGGEDDDGSPYSDALHIYDPDTDSWTEGANWPVERSDSTEFVLDGLLYAVGGEGPYAGSFKNQVHSYDPQTDTWTQRADFPRAAWDRAGAVADGIAYVFSGRDGYGETEDTIWQYDVAVDSWSTVTSIPTSVREPGVVVQNSKIYSFGGQHRESESNGWEITDIQVYDPAADSWEVIGDMPVKWQGPDALRFEDRVLLIDDVVYDEATDGWVENDQLWEFDPASGQWSSHALGAAVPSKVENNTGVIGDVLYLVGGNSTDVWKLDVGLLLNEKPDGVSLSSHNVMENAGVGTKVGTLSTLDPDPDDAHTYSLVAGPGDDDNVSFVIEGEELKTAEVFDFEVRETYSIRVRSTDSAGNSKDEIFTISVTDMEPETEVELVRGVSSYVWSPSGDQIAYVRNVNPDESLNQELHVINADGTGDQVIYEGAERASKLEWYDGWVTFQKQTAQGFTEESPYEGDGELWKIRPDGTGLQQLTYTLENGVSRGLGIGGHHGTVGLGNLFAIDGGQRIVYTAHNNNGWFAPCVSTTDGEDNLVKLDGYRTWNATGVPTSSTVLYTISSNNDRPYAIWSINADGSGKTNIRAEDPDMTFAPGMVMSPSGDRVAFTTGSRSNYDLSIMNVDGTGEVVLAGGEHNEQLRLGSPRGAWSGDGERIVFSSDQSGEAYNVFVIDADGTDIGQLSSSPHEERWASFSSDGNVAFLRDVTDDGIGRNDTLVLMQSNSAPTDVSLSDNMVLENKPVDTVVGTLSTSDPDADDSHTYSLVSGAGDDDNASFVISGNELLTAEEFDFESQQVHNLRVQTQDEDGAIFDQQFEIFTLNEQEEEVLVLATDSSVYAKDFAGDQVLWTYEPGLDVNHLQVVPDGGGQYRVAVNVSDGDTRQVHILDADSGEMIWSAEGMFGGQRAVRAGNPIYQDPVLWPDGVPGGASAPRVVLLAADNSSFTVRSLADGNEFVTFSDAPVQSARFVPDVNGDGVYDVIARRDNDRFYWVDGATGDHLWDTASGTSGKPAGGTVVPDVNGDGVDDFAFGRFYSNTLYMASSADGSFLWTTSGGGMDGDVDVPIPNGDGTYDVISTHQGHAPARWNGADGTMEWRASNGPGNDSQHGSGRLLGTPEGFNVLMDWRSLGHRGVIEGFSGEVLWTVDGEWGGGRYVSLPDQNGDGYEDTAIWDDSSLTIYNGRDGSVLSSLDDSALEGVALLPRINRAPTDISLDSAEVVENATAGTAVGTFSTEDPDSESGFTYSLVDGSGSSENASFAIESNVLKTAEEFDFESQDTYSIRVQTEDPDGNTFAEQFTVSVLDELEDPTVEYFENFHDDAGLTLTPDVDAGAGDVFERVDGTYRTLVQETSDRAQKFALSPTFETVDGNSFEASFDLKWTRSSFGQGLQVAFVSDSLPEDVHDSPLLIDLYGDDHGHGWELYLSDGGDNRSSNSPKLDNSRWYTVSVAYDEETGAADFGLTDRETGEVFFSEDQITLTPGAFNRIALGSQTAAGDGTDAEMYVDNIRVDEAQPFSEDGRYVVGNDLRGGLAVGELDGIFHPDLVIPAYGDNDVKVLLGQGRAELGTATGYAAAHRPTVPVLADFNGDGNLDAAVANNDSANFSLMLGDGSGSLTEDATYSTGSYPHDITKGDFNADGMPDLASVGSHSDRLTVFLNQGDGTFDSTTYSTGSRPNGVGAGDFDGDGDTDLLVSVRVADELVQYWGNGDGTFAEGNHLPAVGDQSANSIQVADFDGDGIDDAVVSHSSPAQLSVYKGTSGGDLVLQETVDGYSQGHSSTSAVADFNEDGLPDLGIRTAEDDVAVLTSNGDFTFSEWYRYGGGQVIACTAGDINDDGLMDVAVTLDNETGEEEIAILLQNNPARVANDRVYLVGGSLSDQDIDDGLAVITVEPGEQIIGSFDVQVYNNHGASAVFPVAATPSWGDHESSYWEIDNWASTGDSIHTVNVDLTAPSSEGTYYLATAGSAVYNSAELMSLTAHDLDPHWNDGNDIAGWSTEQFEQAFSHGYAVCLWENSDGYVENARAATAVTIRVEESPNQAPTVQSLTVEPDPVTQPEDVRLIAGWVNDPDPGDSVTKVEFYRDIDGDDQWDAGDEVLGTDMDGTDGWSVAVGSDTLPIGTNTYLARAYDGKAWSAGAGIASGAGQVQGETSVEVGLGIVEQDGTPGIIIGESFEVEVDFTDVRDPGNPQAVFSGYADIEFDPDVLRVDGIVHDDDFQNAATGTIDNTTGLVDEAGGTDGMSAVEDTRVFTLQMTAVGGGVATIEANAGEDAASEVAVFGSDLDVRDDASYGSASVEVEAMELILQVRDADGNPLPDGATLQKGQEFRIYGLARDLRTTGEDVGVFSAYADVEYDTTLIDVTGITHHEDFSNSTDGTILEGEGLVDEVGGTDGLSQPDARDPQEVFYLSATAVEAGTLRVESNAGEDAGSENTLFGLDVDVRVGTRWGSDQVEIVEHPDLVPVETVVSSCHVLDGQTELSYGIENQGSGPAGAFTTDVVLSRDGVIGNADDLVITTLELDGLGAGEVATGTVALDLDKAKLNDWAQSDDPPGMGGGHRSGSSEWVGLVVDPAKTVEETNEQNNVNQQRGVGKDHITYFPWDIDDSEMVTPTDAIFVINRLGHFGPDLDGRADLDGSGTVTPTDAIAVINRLGYEMNPAVVEVATEPGGTSLSGTTNEAVSRVPVTASQANAEMAHLAELEYQRQESTTMARVTVGDASDPLAAEDWLSQGMEGTLDSYRGLDAWSDGAEDPLERQELKPAV